MSGEWVRSTPVVMQLSDSKRGWQGWTTTYQILRRQTSYPLVDLWAETQPLAFAQCLGYR